ncbi:MAG TPA: dienelactone hydrolase family protein [bacterium]|nr:dienelactone hydrolase family protein [bacterium]HOL36001.1 dienelactone hydrolase family protein [bacterium]HPP09254.1 dienelactone hydrolase family protein [bacterium]
MKNQEKARVRLYKLLGKLPDRNRQVSGKMLNNQKCENYIWEQLVLDLNGIEPVPAYFVKPISAARKFPVIVFNHAHGSRYEIGKDELLLKQNALSGKSWADLLTSHGFAVLTIDCWNFGDRSGRDESALFKELIWKGRILWGLMVYDTIKAIDYLTTRNDIDTNTLGMMGISMGSTMSWWVSALDTRVKACVDICCLTDFEALIETGRLNGHGIYYYVPSLLEYFDTSSINALIAPRPHLSLAGEYDLLTPAKGLDKIDRNLRKVYAQWHADENWELKRYPVGHRLTAEMVFETLNFFKKHLLNKI